MFKFFGKLFSSEKSMNNMIDATVNGLDKLVYTNEEKADYAASNRTEARRLLVEWMDKSSGQNLTRRFLALLIVGSWIAMYLGAAVMSIISVWSDSPEQFLLASEYLANYAEPMSGAVMLCIAFYFAATHMDKVTDVAMTKFGKAPKKIERDLAQESLLREERALKRKKTLLDDEGEENFNS